MVSQTFDVKKGFGTAVKTWRSKLGISQEELADRAGLHRTYICDVERGARNVTLQSIAKLAQALEVSISTLLHSPTKGAPENPPSTMAEDMVEILYIEDNPNDANLAKQGLKSITNRVRIVDDGVKALEFLFGDDKHSPRRPDLILLDLGLPRMHGLEVLRRIKSDSRTADIPVVVLTSSARDRDLQASKGLGADGYIVKPVDLQNLTQVTPQLNLQWALAPVFQGNAKESNYVEPIS